MYTNSLLVLALSATTMVSAHGKVAAVTGDAGGNGTALGIQGAVVPIFGANAATEKDTTVFGASVATKPLSGGLGTTTTTGKITVAKTLATAMKLSGSTLPQVSSSGGTIDGNWTIVTSDGTANDKNGNLFAVVDPTATGNFASGTLLTATSDMVGNGQGNVVQRSIEKVLRKLGKRATNVGASAAFSVKVPAGTTCTGTDATSGATNICLMKIQNNNGNGPFGGSIAFQIAGAAATTTNTTKRAELPFSA